MQDQISNTMMVHVRLVYTSKHDEWIRALMDDDLQTVMHYLAQECINDRAALLEGWISDVTFWECWQCEAAYEQRIMAVRRAWSLSAVCGSLQVMSQLYKAGIDVHQEDELGNNVVHTLIIHASRHPEREEVYLKVFDFISSLLPRQNFEKILLKQNTSGLNCVELAAFSQTFRFMMAIFKTSVYRTKQAQCGMASVNYYDVTEYETYHNGRPWETSPMFLLLFLRNTKLQDEYTKTVFTSGVIGRWLAIRKKVFFPFFIGWCILRLFIIFLVYVPAQLADPPDPAIHVNCDLNLFKFSAETQQCCVIALAIFKTLSLLFDVFSFIKWRSMNMSKMMMYTVANGRMVTRVGFYMTLRSLYNLLILVSSLNRLSWHYWRKSMPAYPIQVIFICIMVGSVWSILFIVQLSPLIGKYVIAIQYMIMSLIKFSFLIFLFIWPFALLFPKYVTHSSDELCPEGFESIPSYFYTSFLLIISLVDLRSFETNAQESLWLLHVVYFIVIALLLLNFLIAIFSEAYSEVADNYEIVNTLQWMITLMTIDFRLLRLMYPLLMKLKLRHFTVIEGRLYIKEFHSHDIRNVNVQTQQQPTIDDANNLLTVTYVWS